MTAEAFAVAAAVATLAERSRGKNDTVGIDSDAALGAMVKGHSDHDDIVRLVEIFWEDGRDCDATIYLERVPTDANLADCLFRLLLGRVGECGWALVRARLPTLGRLCWDA